MLLQCVAKPPSLRQRFEKKVPLQPWRDMARHGETWRDHQIYPVVVSLAIGRQGGGRSHGGSWVLRSEWRGDQNASRPAFWRSWHNDAYKIITGYHIIYIIRLKQVFMTFVGFCWCFRSGPFESPFCQAHRAAMCVPGPQDGMM